MTYSISRRKIKKVRIKTEFLYRLWWMRINFTKIGPTVIWSEAKLTVEKSKPLRSTPIWQGTIVHLGMPLLVNRNIPLFKVARMRMLTGVIRRRSSRVEKKNVRLRCLERNKLILYESSSRVKPTPQRNSPKKKDWSENSSRQRYDSQRRLKVTTPAGVPAKLIALDSV